MEITKALREVAQPTAAVDTDNVNATTVIAPSNADHPVLDVLTSSYVTVIVVVVVILVLVVGLAVYKSCTTWASTRTTTRRRHSSQQQWLTEDNPEMWDEALDGDGEL